MVIRLNVPNVLTVVRFLMIPAFAWFAYQNSYIIATALFAAAWLTDVLDGYIARKYGLVTSFGKIADPMADKFMQVTALVFLTLQGKIYLFIIIVVVIKEILMTIGGFLLYKYKNHVVQSSWFGKISAGSFYVAIILAMLDIPYSNILMVAALVVMIAAFVLYIKKYFDIRKS